MKVRSDFVTNSSSSSFICVRVNYNLQREILEQNGIDVNNLYDLWIENDYQDFDLKGGLVCTVSEGDIAYIGVDVAYQLYDTTVNQHKEKLVETLKDAYGINATEKDVSFDYGEIYNG